MPGNDERHVWVVRASNGSEVGPVSTAQIAQARALGRLTDDAVVRHVDSTAWVGLGAFMARTGPLPAAQVDGTSEMRLPVTSPPPAWTSARPGADDTAPRPALRRSLFAALFDFTFTAFFTARIVGVLYAGVLLFAAGYLLACEYFGVTTIGEAVRASQERGDPPGLAIALGVVIVVAGPVGAVLGVVVGRVALELVVVTFRISETLAEIKARTR